MSVPFTPGPWVIAFDEPHSLPGEPKTYILEDSKLHQLALIQRLPEVGPEEFDAICRVIRAAPELLEALEAYVSEDECILTPDAPDWSPPKGIRSHWEQCRSCRAGDAIERTRKP